ncbi:MAG: glycosyltransferase N-terminal domain-containing protein [Flavobacteriaceae bacterium]|nr:glycosyltransferase N-terminal domain-containing protein [Flavobacteriaceae bacterium]
MFFLYNTSIFITGFLLKIVAVFNKKIRLFVDGRKSVFTKLETAISPSDELIWFHCASLGEFEQGRPVIEKLKTKWPNYKILVTFFSPSGYEVRKNYRFADLVSYLPLDTKANAKKFVEQVNPKVAVFVKYEFWPNLLKELNRKQVKTILISGIFRKEQVFFKGYGRWMRKSLNTFDHFFVQNETSKKLLGTIGLFNVTVSGDTRFDRVYDILNQDNTIYEIAKFIDGKHTLVAGSTWPEDEALFIDYVNNHATKEEKFILAPHNINVKDIEELKTSFTKKTTLFSEKNHKDITAAQVLIIDSIGILTKIYSHANVAYVGGAFKTGLHNILEPATYGVPIIIGPKYQKFNEAIELVEQGGCIVVNSQQEFNSIVHKLHHDKQVLSDKGSISKNYVKNNVGATDHILNYLQKQL